MISRTNQSLGGLLVVANSDLAHDKVLLTQSEIVYNGFDGWIWPLGEPDFISRTSGLADLSLLEKARHYLALDSSRPMRLLFIRERLCAPEARIPDFRRVGIDVGYFESIYNHFSFAFQDVLHGRFDALKEFQMKLNKDGLFDDDASLEAFLEEREKLVAAGDDLEFDSSDRIVRIEVWTYVANA